MDEGRELGFGGWVGVELNWLGGVGVWVLFDR